MGAHADYQLKNGGSLQAGCLIISGSSLSLGCSLNQSDTLTDPHHGPVTAAADALYDFLENLHLVKALIGQSKVAGRHHV
jgi:hypothetical protein